MVFEAFDSQYAMEQAGTVSFGRSKMQYSTVIGNPIKVETSLTSWLAPVQ